jgi:hypothetical protein
MIALVGQLAAALGVERRAVEDQLDLVALADAVDHAVGGDQAATAPSLTTSRSR